MRSKSLSTCIAFVLLLLEMEVSAETSAKAQTAKTRESITLESIARAMKRADTVFTAFVQERHLSLFNEPLRSEGYLCFQKPGRIRWQITKPYQSILISDGSGVAQFEWVDEKWKKLDIGLAAAMQNVVSQIAAVMEGQYAGSQNEYEIQLRDEATGPVVALTPRNPSMRKMILAIEVHLSLDCQSTRQVVLRENNGDFTEIHFHEQIVGIVPPAGTFERNTPLELEKVREAVINSKSQK